MTKRVLVIGGTGAIGVYLVPLLQKNKFTVHVTTRQAITSNKNNLKYIQGDGHDINFLKETLRNGGYNVVIDFMNYSTEEFNRLHRLLLGSCEHYIFLSSYRVFADAEIITEDSPRLLESSTNNKYLATDDYALAKARQEDMLRKASANNWSIIRPAITYSRERFQLGTMEADTFIFRALQNLPVAFPMEMLKRHTTMTWAGDVARLTSKLILKKDALGEDFNVTTSEHHTWEDVIKIYNEVIDIKIIPTSLDNYIKIMGGGFNKYQVNYDRMFNRVMDNSKILRITGEEQKNLVPLREGLQKELRAYIDNPVFRGIDYAKQARFDMATNSNTDLRDVSYEENRDYRRSRYPRTERVRRALRPRTRLKSIKMKLRIRTRLKSILTRADKYSKRIRYRKFDGAILTLTGYFNYGNMIQAYALQEFLRKSNYKFVTYWSDPTHVSGTRNDRFRNTAAFVDRYIKRKPFDIMERFPAYIVGSDQVWRNWSYTDEIKGLGYYFLNFLDNFDSKRVAYAASIGKAKLRDADVSYEFERHVKPLVKKFDAVSMREKSGVDIVRKTWGIKAKHVVDPTMLLTAKDYDKLIRQSIHRLNETKPIFTYILAVNSTKDKIINEVSRVNEMDVERFNLWEFDTLPAVEQWLQGFRDAKVVVTDSFHGVVFSIINSTDFIVIENDQGGLTRMTSLLEWFGLKDRLVSEKEADKFDVTKLQPIDWNAVNDKREMLRKESAEWLLGALK
jgi:nucleoside-diphosphate-sugar epimerase